jgi:hypothetical protein
MAVINIDCPHCDAKRSSFPLNAAIQHPQNSRIWLGFGVCSSCYMPASFMIQASGTNDPRLHPGEIAERSSAFMLLCIYPAPQTIDIPAHVPEPVARAFKQAEHSL